VIEVGSEFQMDGTDHQKARFANSVLTKGFLGNVASDECSVRADSCNLMCRPMFVGIMVLRILHVITATCSQFCDELAASAAGAAMAVRVIVLVPGEQSRLHCSAHALRPEYC